MADSENADKAEKLAAAKKRFEQLKKQKAKKNTGAKKAADDGKGEVQAPATVTDERVVNGVMNLEGIDLAVEGDPTSDETGTSRSATDPSTDVPVRHPHKREPSLSLLSRQRSDSFRRAANSSSSVIASPVSATNAGTPDLPTISFESEAVQDVYRRQAARLELLEGDNKRLKQELADHVSLLQKSEAEVEELQDSIDGMPALKAKAVRAEASMMEVEKLKVEISSLQRQNSQLQSQVSAKRRASFSPVNPGPEDMIAQLASKSSTIEALELEGSNLRHQLTSLAEQSAILSSRVENLESALEQANQRADNAIAELLSLKSSLQVASEDATKGDSQRSFAETRVILLESDLSAAQKAASDAVERSASLEKKVETLRTLHRESETRIQTQTATRLSETERIRQEATDLRVKLGKISNENARLRESLIKSRHADLNGDAGEVEELEDEEHDKLVLRLRDLESENFELRRGIWRERRKELQPPGDGEDIGSPGVFDDIDLSASTSAPMFDRNTSGGSVSYPSAFHTVFSAFTGQRGQDSGYPRTRRDTHQSQGLLSDDGSITFDEEAFRAAQEEEARARVERVKDLKRALKEWHGWRLDLVESRGGAMVGIFDV